SRQLMAINLNRSHRVHDRAASTRVGRPRLRTQTLASGERVEWVFLWLFAAGLAWAPLWYGGNVLVALGVNALLFTGFVVGYELSLLFTRKPHPVGMRHLTAPTLMFAAVLAWIGFQTATWSLGALANPIWGMASDAVGRLVDGSISVDRDLTNLAL